MIVKDFDAFWQAYPRKIGKLAAEKAYQKARKRASQEALLDGVARYVQYKPSYADFAHPATWLNQGRWMDEYENRVEREPVDGDWFAECRQIHGGECGLNRRRHDIRKVIEAGRTGAA